MKRIVAVLFVFALVLSLFGCKPKEGDLGNQTTVDTENGYTLVHEVLSFKFNKDEVELKKNAKAKFDGFKVTEENPDGAIKTKSDALNIAKKEVSYKYNKVQIRYDRTQGIWKITFSQDKETVDAEGKINIESTELGSVYVDEDGYTVATVEK